MNYLKTNPVGIDSYIERIQTLLYTKLNTAWSTSSLDAYGRIYKNELKDKVIPEYYVDEKEYKEVLLDDTKEGIFFFNIGDFIDVNGNLAIVDCEIIFSVDLTKLKGETTREDEQVRNDVFFILNRYATAFDTTNIQIVKGLRNVYSDFRGVADLFKDMQQFHHFKFKGKLRYNINC